MPTIQYDIDFQAQGWSRFTSRLQQNPLMEAYVKGLLAPANELLGVFNDIINHRLLINAVGYQLDLIGSIVGQSRLVAGGTVVYYFGYTGETGAMGYGQAPYRRENQSQTTAILLSDQDYAALIQLKIALNNGHGTIPEVIAGCQKAFNTQNVVLTEQAPAAFTLTIASTLPSTSNLYQLALLYVMKAAGVKITINFTQGQT